MASLSNVHSFAPGAQKGYVWLALRFDPEFRDALHVNIQWGPYFYDRRFTPFEFALFGARSQVEGIVLKLRKSKGDNTAITAKSNGEFVEPDTTISFYIVPFVQTLENGPAPALARDPAWAVVEPSSRNWSKR